MGTGGKSHCKRGHEYNEINTLTYNGIRLCRPCRNIKAKEFRDRNQDKVNSWHKNNYSMNFEKLKACRKEYRASHKHKDAQYNLKIPYNVMLETQDGLCAICRRPPDTKSLHVDHDHKCCPSGTSCGNCVRDLLCRDCNLALGFVNDSKERLQAMIYYLDKHSTSGTI